MVKRDKLGRFTKECVGKENLFYGRHHRKETKIEHGEAMKEKWQNPKFRKNQTKKREGKHYSPTTEFKKGHIPKNPIKKGEHKNLVGEWEKGQKAWNKGHTKETDERVKKGSEKNKLNLDEKGIIKVYKGKKLSSRKIAKKFNCSPIVITRILKENNIEIYPKGFFHKGKSWGKHSEETIKKMMGENNPAKRPEVRKKLSKNLLKYYEKHPEERIKRSKLKIKYYKEHPEAIEEIKKNRAKQILPMEDTSIEVKIQNFLKVLGIEFFTHQKMNIKHSYKCDILIPSMNLVIECDGDFIHCNPIKYPPEFIRYPRYETKTAKEIWEVDNIRTKELREKGFKVLRLWGRDIRNMSIDNFKDKIK